MDPAGRACKNLPMHWMSSPADGSRAQGARVASQHAGLMQRRFGTNSLAKHAPPAACAR
jgi:hypothetical protein